MHPGSHRLPPGLRISLTYSSFVPLSRLSVRDVLTSAALDSDIPALSFISAGEKKKEKKEESRSDAAKSLRVKASEMTAAYSSGRHQGNNQRSLYSVSRAIQPQ